MARGTRHEEAGTTWHLMARGNRGQFVFERPADNRYFLKLLGETLQLFGWQCFGYCLMSNHYHLIIKTPQPNLSRGMRYLNGRFAQYSNHVHERCGHLFHDRFRSEVIDSDSYLATLLQYLALNPVRAGLVDHPSQWRWSSWREVMTEPDAATDWFDRQLVLNLFGTDTQISELTYQTLVLAGLDNSDREQDDPKGRLKEAQKDGPIGEHLTIASLGWNSDAPSLEALRSQYQRRDEGMIAAWKTGHYSYTQIAHVFEVHRTTVSRIVRQDLMAWPKCGGRSEHVHEVHVES
jgi:REP element-mobilizing transposase RayT